LWGFLNEKRVAIRFPITALHASGQTGCLSGNTCSVPSGAVFHTGSPIQ
jgi:hypothetical protein